MRFERKIYLALTLVICAFLPLIFFSMFAVHQLINDENSIIETNARQSLLIERLQFFNAARSRQFLLYVLTKDPAQRDSFYEFHRQFNSVFEEVVKLEVDPPDRELLAKLKRDSDEVFPSRELAFKMVEQGHSGPEAVRYFETTSAPISREVSETAQQLAISAAESEVSARSRMQQTIRKLELEILALAVLASMLLVWATTLIVKVARQKRAVDDQLARISEARKEIVEIVAHDIKSPIATIQMTVELMKEELTAEEGAHVRRSIEMIERSASAVHKLITNLLNHTKIEAGNLVLETRRCDVTKLVDNVATRFKTLALAKNQQLNIEIPKEELLAECDSVRMDQVLSNLIGNALKFTPPNGQVNVTCRKSEGGTKIAIEDSGPGLSEEQIPHIFDRYWQVRKSAQQGTGLGLAIAKSIVEAHRGKIWVESQLGKGTTFSVLLPA